MKPRFALLAACTAYLSDLGRQALAVLKLIPIIVFVLPLSPAHAATITQNLGGAAYAGRAEGQTFQLPATATLDSIQLTFAMRGTFIGTGQVKIYDSPSRTTLLATSTNTIDDNSLLEFSFVTGTFNFSGGNSYSSSFGSIATYDAKFVITYPTTPNSAPSFALPAGTSIVSTLAGSAVGFANGSGTAAQFWGPAGVAVGTAAAPPVAALAGTDITLVDVWVPLPAGGTAFYRLYAQ